MNDEELRRYLEDASAAPLLSPDGERELAALAQEGSDEARERILRANKRLVVSIARRYRGQGLPLLMLVEAGHSGLEHAVDRFDVSKGYKVSTYATWWIRRAITRAIAESQGP